MGLDIRDFSLDWFSLKGKVAIVTGATRNLGLGYATAFAKAGADLFIPHFSDNTATVKSIVEGEGRRIEFLKADLSIREDITRVVDECVKRYGRIDILVNNAAMNYFEDFENFPDEEFSKVIELNLKSVYYLSKEASKVMIRQKSGKIINIGSALSYTSDRKCPSYVTAKHGIIGITRTFANELGKYNIQTNAICPGFFKTDVNLAVSEDPVFYNKINDRISCGRWGHPADLMGIAVFLASRASDYLNGADIKVDGGFAATI
ncbi:MAG: SDR family oxidoreductase [Clostridiales bacterium]|jgi:2-deoxy-D-gluconate 3-dehydrogenase|nr:SDR family oxidoreductase [Clostridiales bacterium]